MSAITWNLPGPDTPGFLRRRRELSLLLDALPTPPNVDALANYLVAFIEAPQDRKEATEALLDLPRAEYGAVIAQLLGFNTAPVPDPKGGSSATP